MLVLEADLQLEQPYDQSGLVIEAYKRLLMCNVVSEHS